MAVRRRTSNRLTLFRTCQTCGQTILTSAETPFVRQMSNVDGKKQKTCYFCSQTCKNASYKHLFDGKAAERRKAREAGRVKAKNRRYYIAHAEQEKARAKAKYWANREAALADMAYQRQKRKLIQGDENGKSAERKREARGTAACAVFA